MTKIITLFKASRSPSDQQVAAEWMMEVAAPAFAKTVKGLATLRIRAVVPSSERLTASNLPVLVPVELVGFDLLTELLFDVPNASTSHLDAAAELQTALTELYSCQACAVVRPTVIKGCSDPVRDPTATTMVTLLKWKDIPLQEVHNRWAAHAPLAVAVHAGAARYEQNWVERSLVGGKIGGVADFSFRTEQDFVERFIPAETDRRRIAADIAGFVAEAQRVQLGPFLSYRS